MTDTAPKSAATETSKKSPAMIAYSVRDAGEESYWDRVGAAFAHKKGGGYDVVLDSMPLNGRITLRVPSEKPEKQAA